MRIGLARERSLLSSFGVSRRDVLVRAEVHRIG